ncbi:MAG: hypothetical protein ACXABV_14515 [Candidatus Thorarchaeota archaeon]|jgi:hypothetical protein
MNSYERNTGMVVCIIGVLIVGAVVVGALSYFGPTTWGWFFGDDTVYYHFDSTVDGTTGTVNLDIDVTTGAVNIDFEDNATLLYRIDVGVSNRTVQQIGAPTVTFTSNTITFDYTVAATNITLGSGVNYTLDVTTTTGAVDCDIIEGAHIGDITLTTETGAIDFFMANGVVILGSPDFNLETTTGAVDLNIVLPTGIGGSIEAAVGTGSIDIDAPGWTEITSNHYESTDYDTASQTVTVVVQTGTGAVEAHIS